MTELSRSLLAAAREGLAPDDAVAARVRAKVAAAVAAGAATTAATTGAQAAVPGAAVPTGPVKIAATKAAGTSPLVKLGAALLVIGLASTVIVMLGSERTPEAPRLTVASTDSDEAPAHVHVAAPNDPLVLPDEPPTTARARSATPEAPGPVETAVPSAPAPAREPATLSREVELIDLAMVSLRKHAPLAAIEAIKVFERETFGHGQMAEDAAAIEIEARCVLREDVTTALATFDRKWPESAQRERIHRTCFARK